LTDAGIRLSVVVSDLSGKSAKAMIKGLLADETLEQLLAYADPRPSSVDDLREALEGDLSDSQRFVIHELMAHLDELEARILRFRQTLLAHLSPYQVILQNLQTLSGIDDFSAAMILVEIGDDMTSFGSPAKLASWAGVCPGQNESAGKRKSARVPGQPLSAAHLV
jgi:transposase